MGRVGAAAAVAVALILTASAGVVAATDLGALLAAAPTSQWIEYGPSTDVLEGSFTAKSYAAYVQTFFTTPVTAEADLDRDGFVAGFGREWEQRATRDYLQERVFEFKSSIGAGDWYQGLRVQAETSQYYIDQIPGLDGIPESFGVVLSYTKGPGHEYRIDFQKGNLMFIIHAGSTSNDLSALAVNQAQWEYKHAPGSAPSSTTAGSHLSGVAPWLIGAGIVIFIGIMSLLVVLIVVLSMRRPVSRPPAGAQISPDGKFWWDGQAWRPRAP